jgi:hypothetical protein
MKKFELKYLTPRNLQNWEGTKKEIIELIKCEFYAENMKIAERFQDDISKAYSIPLGLVGGQFKLKEIID